ncbi:MAG: glutathione synthase [Gammaproteobacteria bacterium]|nr:glutathione synthase [Gammaproteobacteria bacterium]
MDPISGISIAKDSTFAMLLEAQSRAWDIYYMEMDDLFLVNDIPSATTRKITVEDEASRWYQFHKATTLSLFDLDVILMRKDPPFNMEYIYTTYLLELAHRQGTLVVNDPASLRDANEKLFVSWFPQCTTPTLVARKSEHILAFLDEHRDIVLKPLDAMGGASIFRVQHADQNTNVIIETLTDNGDKHAMVQRFIPEIVDGDKRILIINGEPVPYALARIPKEGEIRGNLAAGGSAKGVELNNRDRWICEQLAPTLKEKGLLFVGIDVIGDYLTEINVTSPTCIRELDTIYKLNIAGDLMDAIEQHIP